MFKNFIIYKKNLILLVANAKDDTANSFFAPFYGIAILVAILRIKPYPLTSDLTGSKVEFTDRLYNILFSIAPHKLSLSQFCVGKMCRVNLFASFLYRFSRLVIYFIAIFIAFSTIATAIVIALSHYYRR